MKHTVPIPVDQIMREIRSGLANTSLSETALAAIVGNASAQAELRKAADTASVLGRCGGSLRGKLCTRIAPLVRPVIEQLDLFHAAVMNTLNRLAGEAAISAETTRKVSELETRLTRLEAEAGGDSP